MERILRKYGEHDERTHDRSPDEEKDLLLFGDVDLYRSI
jgi:hypothetical protein